MHAPACIVDMDQGNLELFARKYIQGCFNQSHAPDVGGQPMCVGRKKNDYVAVRESQRSSVLPNLLLVVLETLKGSPLL